LIAVKRIAKKSLILTSTVKSVSSYNSSSFKVAIRSHKQSKILKTTVGIATFPLHGFKAKSG